MTRYKDYTDAVEAPLAMTALDILQKAEDALTAGDAVEVVDRYLKHAERYLRLTKLRRSFCEVLEGEEIRP